MPDVAALGLPIAQFFDDAGIPLAGGTLSTFEAGTDTPAYTYTDSTGTTPNQADIPLDLRGEATFWPETGKAYKYVLRDTNGVEIWTKDNVIAIANDGSLGADLASGAAGKGSNLVVDSAPVASVDSASPAQGLSYVVNSVVDIARMANNFGAGGNDTVAMQKAIRYAAQNGGKLFLRGGVTARHGALSLTGVREFWGDGPGASVLLPMGTLPNYAALLTCADANGMGIRNLSVSLDVDAYLTQVVLSMTNPTNVEIDNVHIPAGGSCPFRATGATGLKLNKIRVDDYSYIGLYALDSVRQVEIQGCTVRGTGVSHAISIIGGGSHAIRDNYTEGAKIFGASLFNVDGGKITGNTFQDGYVEACNVQDTQNFQIIGNSCYQRRDGLATDFGMSVYGDPTSDHPTKYGLVANNAIFGCFKSGIALAANVTNTTVTGNHITSPNTADEVFGAGVLLYGTGCQQNHVHGNTIIDEGSKMRWGVNEWTGYGDGAPSYNIIGESNHVVGSGTLIGENNVLSANSEAWDSRFANFTPTLTGSGGTLTYTVNNARFKRRGKLVTGHFSITITALGGVTGALTLSLPINAGTDTGLVIGKEPAVSAKAFSGSCNASGAVLTFADGTGPGAVGARLVGTFEYEPA